MLWLHETSHHRRRVGLGVVVRHRRPTPLARSHDTESALPKRRNVAGRPAVRVRSGAVQDHESRRTAAHRFGTVPGKIREGHQNDHFANVGRSFESYIG